MTGCGSVSSDLSMASNVVIHLRCSCCTVVVPAVATCAKCS